MNGRHHAQAAPPLRNPYDVSLDYAQNYQSRFEARQFNARPQSSPAGNDEIIRQTNTDAVPARTDASTHTLTASNTDDQYANQLGLQLSPVFVHLATDTDDSLIDSTHNNTTMIRLYKPSRAAWLFELLAQVTLALLVAPLLVLARTYRWSVAAGARVARWTEGARRRLKSD